MKPTLKKRTSVLYYSSVGLIVLGTLLRLTFLPGGAIFIFLGLWGLFIFYIFKTATDIKAKKTHRMTVTLEILIVLMSVILYTRYLYYPFGDYPGLVIIPIFFVVAVLYLVSIPRDIKNITTVVLYLLLIIPLFGVNMYNAPRQYIPTRWYNRYNVAEETSIVLPFPFKYDETRQLSQRAFELRKKKRYFEAIDLYHKARELEPENPRILFDMSDAYARTNELETAVALLDTAIHLDDKVAPFYNNRGLLHYKLAQFDEAIKDYKTGIEIDSTNPELYLNLALAYHEKDMYYESYEAIEEAEGLGINLNEHKLLKRIKEDDILNYKSEKWQP